MWLSRIILKNLKFNDPWTRLYEYHPCAVIIFRNQNCLKVLHRNLNNIHQKYTIQELKNDKSLRIKAYQDYGMPQVVIIYF